MHLVLHSDDITCHGHLAMTNVLKRSGKLGMLLRDEFLTPLRYYDRGRSVGVAGTEVHSERVR